MQWIDIAILGIIGISALISVARGFVKEILSLVAWAASFFVAINYYDQLTTLFSFKDHSVRVVLALLVLFIGTLIVIGLINYIVTLILQKTGLSGTDRLLGMVFGAIRGLIIVLVIAAVFQLIINIDAFAKFAEYSWYKDSVLLPEINKFAIQILTYFNLYK
ncbi:MAG: CvpA family protein [Succinivibrionaceae bacterium]